MKLTGALLMSALPVLLAAAPAPAPVPPPVPPPPAKVAVPDHLAPASNYTEQEAQVPMAPEYDPATSQLQPAYAEPSDEDGTRHCVGPDGVKIFTDRRCSDLGAMPQVVLPPFGGGAVTPGMPLRVRTCARNQSMLLEGVRAALESHDANRLADYYHWTGMSSAQGYQLMERLDAFSERQVVDVRLVREARPDDESLPDLFSDRFDDPLPMPPLDPALDPVVDPDASPTPPPRRRPLASMLRVDQMRSATDASANVTYFRLLTNAGCWWMRF